MSKLIIVSNRLPVTVSSQGGEISYYQSVGGVATGISSLSQPRERLWIGWSGLPSDGLTPEIEQKIVQGLGERGCGAVSLNSADINDFYSGFSNKTIWPLFHYFAQYTVYEDGYWDSYRNVNQKFCDEVIRHAADGDRIWVHDYQLMLLPRMIRDKVPGARIGFFLHIPFPSFELIRLLPWRRELLEGLLGADLVGFHEYEYVRHFLSSVYRITGHEHHLSEFVANDRLVRVDAFPMGIDYDKYANSRHQPDVSKQIANFNGKPGVRIIISVDRLDYTKGILNRLEAYDRFLTINPDQRGKVSMLVIAVPSRTKVEQYNLLREEIERLVGRINGTYGTLDWTPISYMYRSLPFNELAALYNIADVALISPLRDGMNLVAKEFVACQHEKDHQGILILSEMAGAAGELGEAVIINPFDKTSVVKAIKYALEMPQEERLRRNRRMQARVSRYTVGRWAKDFIDSLDDVVEKNKDFFTRKMSPKIRDSIAQAYAAARGRLFLLDYDGTLSPFARLPEDAMPDVELLDSLRAIAGDPRNEVVIISGRDKKTLTAWLGELPVHLVAEHGALVRPKGGNWRTTIPSETDWKQIIRPIMDLYVDRTPGSFVEDKNYSLVWHCRKSEPDLAKLRTQELKDAVMAITVNLNVGVFEGSKIVEVKHIDVNKGRAVLMWLSDRTIPFIFCAGDDYTDEDMFGALPKNAVSCKVGQGPSKAKYRLNSPQELRALLKNLQR